MAMAGRQAQVDPVLGAPDLRCEDHLVVQRIAVEEEAADAARGACLDLCDLHQLEVAPRLVVTVRKKLAERQSDRRALGIEVADGFDLAGEGADRPILFRRVQRGAKQGMVVPVHAVRRAAGRRDRLSLHRRREAARRSHQERGEKRQSGPG